MKKKGKPVLVLDAGDALARRKGWARNAEPDAKELARRAARAELILKYYKQVGATAMAVGPEDLLLGIGVVEKLGRKVGAKLLSANLKDKAGRKPFKGSALVKSGDWKVGLVAVTWPQRFQKGLLEGKKLKFDDPVAAARREAESLKNRGAQFIVLLAATDRKKATEILNAVKDINLALVSGIGWLREPIKVGSTYMVGVPAGGKHIGLVELHVLNDSLKFEDMSQRYTILDQVKRTVNAWKRMKAMGSRGGARFADRYARRMQGMARSVKRQVQRFKEANAKGTSSSYLVHMSVGLDSKVGDDATCKKMVDEVKKAHDINDLRRRRRPMPRMPSIRGKGRAPLRMKPVRRPNR